MSRAKKRRSAYVSTAKRKARTRRYLIVGAVGLAVAVAVLVAVTPEEPQLEDVETFPYMSREHLEAGDPLPDYNSSPATSGAHAPQPAPCGIYRQEVPDVIGVHNLEHGTVVIQYQPSIPGDEVSRLEGFARGHPTHILVAPRSDLDGPVVVTAWTKMLRLDSADLDSIEVFYDRYARSGPEPGIPCPLQVDEAGG